MKKRKLSLDDGELLLLEESYSNESFLIEKDEYIQSLKCINRSINQMHEYVGPKFTKQECEKYGITEEYGGITGNISLGSFRRIFDLLKSPEFEYQMTKDSIFCDIGSGTGRPSMYFSLLDIKGSIGFDVDPLQVYTSHLGQQKIAKNKSIKIKSPLLFFHANLLSFKSLEPITHIYSFLGYAEIVNVTAFLIAKSKSVEVFVAIVLRNKELKECGMLSNDPDENKDITVLNGLAMRAGNKYSGYVIPITDERRKRILKFTSSKAFITNNKKSIINLQQMLSKNLNNTKNQNKLIKDTQKQIFGDINKIQTRNTKIYTV